MIKIELKTIFGKLIFTHESENNTISETVKEYIKREIEAGKISADLSFADLSSADLSYADLSSADLSYANLRYADLRYANLSFADLSSADLSYADLSSADLSYANLSSADLSSANLSSADLSSADLSYADLRYANLDKKYISISRIGSAKRMTTYCFEDDIIWCGCFTGTLKKFEDKVNETHKDNPQYLKEYLGFINYLKSLQ